MHIAIKNQCDIDDLGLKIILYFRELQLLINIR